MKNYVVCLVYLLKSLRFFKNILDVLINVIVISLNTEKEFKEFEPRFKSAKTRFELSVLKHLIQF